MPDAPTDAGGVAGVRCGPVAVTDPGPICSWHVTVAFAVGIALEPAAGPAG